MYLFNSIWMKFYNFFPIQNYNTKKHAVENNHETRTKSTNKRTRSPFRIYKQTLKFSKTNLKISPTCRRGCALIWLIGDRRADEGAIFVLSLRLHIIGICIYRTEGLFGMTTSILCVLTIVTKDNNSWPPVKYLKKSRSRDLTLDFPCNQTNCLLNHVLMKWGALYAHMSPF